MNAPLRARQGHQVQGTAGPALEDLQLQRAGLGRAVRGLDQQPFVAVMAGATGGEQGQRRRPIGRFVDQAVLVSQNSGQRLAIASVGMHQQYPLAPGYGGSGLQGLNRGWLQGQAQPDPPSPRPPQSALSPQPINPAPKFGGEDARPGQRVDLQPPQQGGMTRQHPTIPDGQGHGGSEGLGQAAAHQLAQQFLQPPGIPAPAAGQPWVHRGVEQGRRPPAPQGFEAAAQQGKQIKLFPGRAQRVRTLPDLVLQPADLLLQGGGAAGDLAQDAGPMAVAGQTGQQTEGGEVQAKAPQRLGRIQSRSALVVALRGRETAQFEAGSQGQQAAVPQQDQRPEPALFGGGEPGRDQDPPGQAAHASAWPGLLQGGQQGQQGIGQGQRLFEALAQAEQHPGQGGRQDRCSGSGQTGAVRGQCVGASQQLGQGQDQPGPGQHADSWFGVIEGDGPGGERQQIQSLPGGLGSALKEGGGQQAECQRRQ